MTKAIRVVRTRRGARLVQDGLIVSEVLRSPGPTHTLFDVLAASMAALAPGPKTAMLGFAAGGIIAPLRAMGFGHPLVGVDLSLDGEPLFRELSEPWCGDVRLTRADAATWLKRGTSKFDLILEDLSADTARGVTKPDVSLGPLPALMRARLAPGGIVVTNVLPVPGMPFTRLLPHLARPFRHACAVVLDEWENRVLIAGAASLSARAISIALRRHLEALGSEEATKLHVRTLK